MNPHVFEFFLQFHHGIPRQGPGTAEATALAFRRVEGMLPRWPAILDLGCGSGGQTLTVAALTEGTILAIDNDPVLVEELRARVAERGLEGRVTVQVGDMRALAVPPQRFDLVWCEGAIFVLGFEEGLRTLRPLLRGPGLAVVSEAVWLRPAAEIPAEVRAFWEASYPTIAGVEENLARTRRAGFEAVDHFTLPEAGWAAYVDPLERRMEEVLAQHPGDPHAAEAAAAERREFEMFRRHLRWFGYEFFLLRRHRLPSTGRASRPKRAD